MSPDLTPMDIYILICVEDQAIDKKTSLKDLNAGIRNTDELTAPQMFGCS
jgi:hypothetical protein